MILPFASTREEARRWLGEAAEARKLLDDGHPLPVEELDDVSEGVERVRVGGVLSPTELRGISRMLLAARVMRRFLTARKGELPALFTACTTDPTLDALADEISQSFEPDGTLADHASTRLRELRTEWRGARRRMLARMDDLMSRYEDVLQDRFVTEREGRWVLPVRSDAHERFPGIVHATSSSGATLFVEPRSVVGMGNRLKVLEAEVRREEEAVYARLSAMLSDALPSVEAALHALSLADVRAATAKLAEDIGLSFPEVTDDPRVDLREARHPLLALDALRGPPLSSGDESPALRVVPSDLAVAAGRAIVVSGPNAGGKTVALKTLGLAALMLRAGLPVACGEGSTVGLFDVVLTDVGDDQSLQKNLSTFSAHVSNLAAVLEDTTRGALVLLDELAGGTDPREGEALAAGVMDSLCARGGAIAVTTHYEGLKALAAVDARFENASVGFDLATMTPTFRLAMGVPGSSSALAVARRFGLPQTVIDRAERFLTREDHSFETVLKKLNDERAAFELARAAADQRELEARQASVRLEAELEAAKNREKRILSEGATALMDHLQRAREELRAAQARLRVNKKLDPQAVREAERTIERLAGEVAIGGSLESLVTNAADEPGEAVRVGDLRKGQRVWVPRLRAEAEVVDLLGDGRVRVAAGPLKMTVSSGELRAPPVTEPSPTPTRRAAVALRPQAEGVLVQSDDNTCDLRGLRVDDGLAMTSSFLDRAVNSGWDVVFLLHGHGTGALREAIRRELARSPYVARSRGGVPGEGGEAVTVVWLA
jgi:DNA mismatch repair protein MutS2